MIRAKENKITVLGSGESGMGAAMLAAKHGFSVLVSDHSIISKKRKAEMYGQHISYEENGHSFDRIKESGLVIKSPGIPDSAPIIQKLKSEGVSIISEIEFGFRYFDGQIIAITGSNGKTTTSLLTYHLLKTAGLNVGLGGNIGHSFARMLTEKEYDIIVLELSSFQLEEVKDFKANTSVILNITPDHLDRYEYDIDKYANAKLNIVNNQLPDDLVIYNADDQLVSGKVKERNTLSRKLSFSLEATGESEVRLIDEHIEVSASEEACKIAVNDMPLIGKHNIYNSMAALSVACNYGVSCSNLKEGLSTFENAPHRLEYVDTVDDIRFINDSKATNVDSVYYALEGINQPIIWIAGGINKGNDYSQIYDLVKSKVRSLVCIGLENDHLVDAFTSAVDKIIETDTMTNAVNSAFDMAKEGYVVLLSPACSSFDLFENYESRGNYFKDSVLKLKKKLKASNKVVV